MTIDPLHKGIIFYDSECLLCDFFIDCIAKRDKIGKFLFSSVGLLEAETSVDLSYLKKINEKTILLLYKGRYYKKSRALLKIFRFLDWKYRIFVILYILPAPILDVFYNLIAKYRKVIFKGRQSCLIQKNSVVPARLVRNIQYLKPYIACSKPVFLSAQWQNLIMINYELDPAVLRPFLPLGTELDSYEGSYYVSLVCFQFVKTKVKGVMIPLHVNFDEINLRFYVKRKRKDFWERGVVFIKEFVPKPAITWVANALYNENYQVAQMKSHVDITESKSTFQYLWQIKNTVANSVKVSVLDKPKGSDSGSIQEYIAEHYFGYVIQRDGSTKEYEVKHPAWRIWERCSVDMKVDFKGLYGETFAFLDQAKPKSVFVAEGSMVTVHEAVDIYF